MNRPIRFRAWTSKRIASPSFVQGDLNENLASMILMQFTGWKSKSGIEVYEGDIVDISGNKNKKNMPQLVGWDAKMGKWCFCYDTGEPLRDINRGDKDKWEVIGNIWENGDLLK